MEEVVLISRSTLLGSLPQAAGEYALQWLSRRKNVKVLLHNEIVGAPYADSADIIDSASGSRDSSGIGFGAGPVLSYNTLKGDILKGDMFIDCTGRNPRPVPPNPKEIADMLITSDIVSTSSAVSSAVPSSEAVIASGNSDAAASSSNGDVKE